MDGERITELVWLLEIAVLLAVSVYQFWTGLAGIERARQGFDRRLAWGRLVAGSLGLIAFLWLGALLFNSVFVFPTDPPPGVVCLECYNRLRSLTNRVLLLGGFAFVILLVCVPAVTDWTLKRWWSRLSDAERAEIRDAGEEGERDG